MNKLLSANFARLWKNRPFWVSMILMLVSGIYFPVSAYFDMKRFETQYKLDERLFFFVIFIGIILSVFCSLYVGTEYSDGTIRNKLMIGHTRTAVYLANLMVCTAAGIAMCFVSLTVSVTVGIPLFGFLQDGILKTALFLLCSLGVTVAYTAVFVGIAMLVHSKTMIAVVSILGAFILLIAAFHIQSSLEQPKMWDAYTYMSDTGELITDEAMPNPNYLSGTKRAFYEFLRDFLPGGQSMQIAEGSIEAGDIEKPGSLLLYDAVILIVVTGAGIAVFRKKDIK